MGHTQSLSVIPRSSRSLEAASVFRSHYTTSSRHCLFHETQSFTNPICFTQQSQPQQCCSLLHHQPWPSVTRTSSTTAESRCTSLPSPRASTRTWHYFHLRDTLRLTASPTLVFPSSLLQTRLVA